MNKINTANIERLLELSIELTNTMKVIIDRAKELYPEYNLTEIEQRNIQNKKELITLLSVK